jgi:Kef-type K+ transport system membrane component KefB
MTDRLTEAPGGQQSRWMIRKLIACYGLMLAACVALFLIVRIYGERLSTAPSSVSHPLATAGGSGHSGSLFPVLTALVTVIIAARLLGALFRRFHQPPVMGEVLAGILLGPSFLGWLAPGIAGMLISPAATQPLGVIAQLGVLLFMFLVGLELNIGVFRRNPHSIILISQAGIAVPFLLGSALALWLYPKFSSDNVSFTAFALFLGISMSITAFPVLARILSDRKLQNTPLGTAALTCAAIGDVTAWCLLAFVVGVIQSQLAGAGLTLLLTLLYIVLMFVAIRPLFARLVARWERKPGLDQSVMAVVFIVLLLSSLITEYIGIHTLFGAFFFGAIIPHESKVARVLRKKLHDFVIVLLLPAFFAFTGLRTQIDLIQGSQWLVCAAIILVACLGKFGGSMVAARLSGMNLRDAASLGILMNTRGLMELIVLNIGLDFGVISPQLFAMLVIMAIITTFATTPILDALTPAPIGIDPSDDPQNNEGIR